MQMLSEAHKLAQRSPLRRHKTGAVLCDIHDNILSTGWSHMSETSLNQLYSFHAELHALWNLKGNSLHPARRVYICTISGAGNVTLARPCVTCAIALLRAGIKYACYTTAEGTYEDMMLEDHLDKLKLYTKPPLTRRFKAARVLSGQARSVGVR